nr:zinc finger, CCHC-type [Tanacetum cinerariifolium]
MVNSMLSYSGLSQGFWDEAMLTACYLLNRVLNKRNMITPYELWTKRKQNLNSLRVWGCKAVVRLLNPKLKTFGKRGIECSFVGYAEHSKAFRFFVIEPNDSVSINSIIKSKDAIFDENRFSSALKPSQRISKRNKTPKNFRPEFQLYLIEGTMDEVYDQHYYCFNVDDDPKTCDKTIKSQDVAFWNEAINDETDFMMDGAIEKFKARLVIHGLRQKSGINYFDTYASVVRINTIRLLIDMASIHNLIIHQMDVKTTFLNGELDEEVYMNQPQGFIMPEFLLSMFSIKDMGEVDVILGIRIKHESNGITISQSHYIEKVLKKFNYFDCTPVSTHMDTSEKLMPNNDQVVSQLEYSRVIVCLMYAMTCTRPDIASAMGKLIMYTKLEGYTDARWISNTEDNSSTVACAATLAKAYSQIYNGNSRHIGVKHNMIRKLITNGVVYIEFVKSQQNLDVHLTKGLARDLVIKSAEGMCLKSN